MCTLLLAPSIQPKVKRLADTCETCDFPSAAEMYVANNRANPRVERDQQISLNGFCDEEARARARERTRHFRYDKAEGYLRVTYIWETWTGDPSRRGRVEK